MEAKRVLVVNRFLKGETPNAIFKSLSGDGFKRTFVYDAINRYKETKCNKDRRRSGRPRTKRTEIVIKRAREQIRRKKQRSVRKMASQLEMSKSSAHNLLRIDLQLTPYKKQKIHGVSAAVQEKRYERVQRILNWHAGDDIVFSDEKLFVLELPHNPQNDRIWAASIQDIPDNQLYVPRNQNSASVMVWGAVCKRGKLPLVFIEKGVKIDRNVYIRDILEAAALPGCQAIFGDEYYLFQQDGAPSHTANDTQRWCERNFCDFMPKNDWPPSSPDLNPLDFFVWGFMLEKLKNKKIQNLAHFKKIILKVWNEIPQEYIRAACNSFEKRLRLVKAAKGGIIRKHLL